MAVEQNYICLNFLNKRVHCDLASNACYFSRPSAHVLLCWWALPPGRGPGSLFLVDFSCKGISRENGFNFQLFIKSLSQTTSTQPLGHNFFLVVIAEPLISISNFYFQIKFITRKPQGTPEWTAGNEEEWKKTNKRDVAQNDTVGKDLGHLSKERWAESICRHPRHHPHKRMSSQNIWGHYNQHLSPSAVHVSAVKGKKVFLLALERFAKERNNCWQPQLLSM